MVAFGDGGVSHMLIGDSGLSATVCNGNGKVSHTFIGDSLQWRQWGLQSNDDGWVTFGYRRLWAFS